MTKYLDDLLGKMYSDNGKKMNILIDSGIIDINYLVEDTIKNGETHYLYTIAKYIKLEVKHIYELAMELISRRSVIHSYYFAKDVEGAPIVLLENYIVSENDPKYIYLFARDIEGANIKKLEEAIIKTNDPEYIYLFARNIKTSDKNLLFNALVNLGAARFVLEFFESVTMMPLEKVERALIDIGDDDVYQKFLMYKYKMQDREYEFLNKALDNNDIDNINKYRDNYEYLFKDISSKKLVKER